MRISIIYVMRKKITKNIFFSLCLLIGLLLIGCGSEWREFTFTKAKPRKSDLIGTWVPTSETLKDMKNRGKYSISKHELILRADGSFSLINMPDWWKDGFGVSKKGFESGSGTWDVIQEDKGILGKTWEVKLNFPTYWTHFNLLHQAPPYLIHCYIGDPDSGTAMIFERKKN